jgi:hypothetical protein
MTGMALSCAMVPDHSTMAGFVSSLQAELVSLGHAVLRGCAEQWL